MSLGTTYTQMPSAPIGGGDVLDFCATGALGITLRHIDTNAVARTFSFTSPEAC